MEKIREHIKYAKLLSAHVMDELDEQQKAELHQWEKMAGNSQLKKEILNADAFTDWKEGIDKLQLDDHWMHFLHAMQQERKQERSIPVRLCKAAASVAAAVLIGFTSFYTYHLMLDDHSWQTVEEAHIVPGTTNASLVLDNGHIVDLTENELSHIQEGAVSITNTEGVLAYPSKKRVEPGPAATNTLIVPRGGEYQLVLPDGTQVYLNADSELTYPVTFSGNKRKVLLKGEAYFDVLADQNRPFIVDCGDQSIEVMGTAFNVSAYEGDDAIVTTLVEGRVTVQTTTGDEVAFDTLMPHEQLVVNRKSGQRNKQEVDTGIYTSWKDGRFIFKNEALEVFMGKLARWYDVEIIITDDRVKNIRFTGDLPRYKEMSNILKILEEETSVSVDIKDNKIIYVSR
ncbi:FecR family protein [Carboxylicivirga sp. RSCT41]|uniref:FecR family protein n=1 Tax=Carboxylicivirga agarovorans TaxID=3417570 RepID=UPI003D35654A